MAVVRHLDRQALNTSADHTETDCTYSIVIGRDGGRYLQLDTYGSAERKIAGKKSQSIRLSIEALRELKLILQQDFSL